MVEGTNILVGVGGYIPEYGKPLYSNVSTLETVRRQMRMIKWYSRFSFDVYVMQDQLISKNDSKQAKDLEAVEQNKYAYAELGETIKKLKLDSWVHTGHYISPSTGNPKVKEKTALEIKRASLICRYSNRRIRHVTTHLGWCYKNRMRREEALDNSISFFSDLNLGNLICIENDDSDSKLGRSKDVLKACEQIDALPLFDIAHYKLLEGKNWYPTFLKFSEYWNDTEPIIFHYSTTDRKGVHLPLDPKDFRECVRMLLKLEKNIAIELEVPQNTRIHDAKQAKSIIEGLRDGASCR